MSDLTDGQGRVEVRYGPNNEYSEWVDADELEAVSDMADRNGPQLEVPMAPVWTYMLAHRQRVRFEENHGEGLTTKVAARIRVKEKRAERQLLHAVRKAFDWDRQTPEEIIDENHRLGEALKKATSYE